MGVGDHRVGQWWKGEARAKHPKESGLYHIMERARVLVEALLKMDTDWAKGNDSSLDGASTQRPLLRWLCMWGSRELQTHCQQQERERERERGRDRERERERERERKKGRKEGMNERQGWYALRYMYSPSHIRVKVLALTCNWITHWNTCNHVMLL